MTQALQTSATGINVGQQQINVIANNVANITDSDAVFNLVLDSIKASVCPNIQFPM